MFEKAKSGRDAFTFSLHGMTTIASFTFAPAIAEDRINKTWDERLETAGRARVPLVRRIEDFLGRYYTLGPCHCAQA